MGRGNYPICADCPMRRRKEVSEVRYPFVLRAPVFECIYKFECDAAQRYEQRVYQLVKENQG